MGSKKQDWLARRVQASWEKIMWTNVRDGYATADYDENGNVFFTITEKGMEGIKEKEPKSVLGKRLAAVSTYLISLLFKGWPGFLELASLVLLPLLASVALILSCVYCLRR